jgi:hypothetical protein
MADDNKTDDQGQNGNGPDKTEKTVPYERFQKINEQKKQAEETLTALVDELKADLPEEFQGLIPNLPPAEQIKWIRSASKAGLFKPAVAANSPDHARPGSSRAVSFEGMNPYEMIEYALKNTK